MNKPYAVNQDLAREIERVATLCECSHYTNMRQFGIRLKRVAPHHTTMLDRTHALRKTKHMNDIMPEDLAAELERLVVFADQSKGTHVVVVHTLREIRYDIHELIAASKLCAAEIIRQAMRR